MAPLGLVDRSHRCFAPLLLSRSAPARGPGRPTGRWGAGLSGATFLPPGRPAACGDLSGGQRVRQPGSAGAGLLEALVQPVGRRLAGRDLVEGPVGLPAALALVA